MDVKNLIMGVIALSLGAVMIAGALLPSVSSAVDNTREYYNNSFPTYAELNEEDITISFSGVDGYKVNDESISTVTYARLIMSDKLIAYRSGNTCLVDYWLNDSLVRVSNGQSFTITVSGGTTTVSVVNSGGDTVTNVIDCDWMYYANNIGDYRMYQIDNSNSYTVNINTTADLVALCWTNNAIYSLKDGVVAINGTAAGAFTADLVPRDGVIGVNTIFVSNNPATSKLLFDIDGTLYGVNALLVPYEVFGTKENMAGVEPLFNAIPLIAVAGLVMAGVYVFISRK